MIRLLVWLFRKGKDNNKIEKNMLEYEKKRR